MYPFFGKKYFAVIFCTEVLKGQKAKKKSPLVVLKLGESLVCPQVISLDLKS